MKYFTRELYDGLYRTRTVTDQNLTQARHEYEQHLKSPVGQMPDDVLELARLPGTDDGLVVEVRLEVQAQHLSLTLRCGNLQLGYYDLFLPYEQAEITPRDLQELAGIVRATKTCWEYTNDLYIDEIDLSDDGRIEHQLCFHTRYGDPIYITVRCGILYWQQISRPDRTLPELQDRFSDDST